MSILLADELNDKLKLLDYEDKFCNVKDIVPFPRTYFCIPAQNQGYGSLLCCVRRDRVVLGRHRCVCRPHAVCNSKASWSCSSS